MGSNKTPTDMRGLLIPDPRFSFAGGFDDTNSVFTENTPRPGVPIAKDDSDLILETSGTTGSGGKYTIYTQNSGYPEDLGGTFLWHDTASSDTYKHYGWEPPHTINGFERVDTGDSSLYYINFDSCTTLDDTLIIAGVEEGTGVIKAWSKSAKATTWTETTLPSFLEPGMQLVPGNRKTDATGGSEVPAGVEPGPALCVLPSGRVLCFFWIRTAEELTTTSANSSFKHWQIQAAFTDDNGANWSMYQNFCLIEPFSQLVDARGSTNGRYYPGRLRAAYKDGQILLISSAYDTGVSDSQGAPSFPGNVYVQWASSSLGASFTSIETNTREANSAAHYDIAVSGGQFVISYLTMSATGAIPYVAFLGSAFTPLSRSSSSAISVGDYGKDFAELLGSSFGNAVGRADLSICAVPDGSMYLVGVRHGHESVGYTKNSVALMHSGDNGNTWSLVGGEWGNTDAKKDGIIYSPRFFDEPSSAGATARDTLRNVAITWQRGRLALACRFEDSPSSGDIYTDGDPDYNVSCLYLGGYSNLTIGSIDAAIDMADRGTYARHYLPFVAPDTLLGAWTKNGAGGVSAGVALNGAMPYYKISTTGGDLSFEAAELNHTETQNDRAESYTWGGPMLTYAEFAVEVISGGTTITRDIAFEMQNGNTDAKTKVALLFAASGDDTTVTVRDVVAASNLHSATISFSAADKFGEYRMAIVGRQVTVWWREYSTAETKRTWTKFYESSSSELSELTGSGYCRIEWGNINSATAHSRWYKVQAGAHDGDLNHCAVPRLNDWMGFASPANVGGRFYSTSQIYMEAGLQIAAKDGPAVKGDEWEHTPRHDHPVEALHHEISPSPNQKWTSNGRSVATELIWKLDENDPSIALGGTRALYLGNVNFRYAVLYGYNGTTWGVITTIDAAKQVKYHRRGNSITALYSPAPSSDQTGDTYYQFDDLSGCTFNFQNTGTPDLTQIASSSEGVFETGSARAPVLILDGDLSSKPTTGDGQIWAKDLCVVLPESHTQGYQKLKLTIPVDVPGVTGSNTNTTETGNWEIGVAVWGHVAVFGNQYSNGHIRGMATNTELFTATGGQRRAVKRGPVRRSVEFSWQDPIDVSQLADANPSPNYILTTGGSAKVASVGDTPFLVQGLLARLQGSMVPVVYLPKLPTANGNAYTIKDRNRFLYGRIVSAEHRIENQIGDEWTGSNAGETVTATAIRIEEEV